MRNDTGCDTKQNLLGLSFEMRSRANDLRDWIESEFSNLPSPTASEYARNPRCSNAHTQIHGRHLFRHREVTATD